jgi:Cupin
MTFKSPPSVPPVDRLAALLRRFRVQAQLFHTGALCGVTHFPAQAGRGFLHVLSQGETVITHRRGAAVPKRMEVRVPTLMFYPQALTHEFHNAPMEGAQFIAVHKNKFIPFSQAWESRVRVESWSKLAV